MIIDAININKHECTDFDKKKNILRKNNTQDDYVYKMCTRKERFAELTIVLIGEEQRESDITVSSEMTEN